MSGLALEPAWQCSKIGFEATVGYRGKRPVVGGRQICAFRQLLPVDCTKTLILVFVSSLIRDRGSVIEWACAWRAAKSDDGGAHGSNQRSP